MAKIKGAIVVDTERCKGCNLCVVACPLHVVAEKTWKERCKEEPSKQRLQKKTKYKWNPE